MKMKIEEFHSLCNLLPEGVYWGDPITPRMVKEIVQALLQWQPIASAPLDGYEYLFADWRVSDGHCAVLWYDEETGRLMHKTSNIGYPLDFFTHWMRIPELSIEG